jgi:Disulphide bond corrector protein DsbC
MRGGCILAALLLSSTAVAQARPMIRAGTPHARATIQAVTVAPGTTELLVTLHVDPGWHVSWRNPGDTGLPTRLLWSLPRGVSVSSEVWPVPLITHTPVGVTHTLEGSVPWLVRLRTPREPVADRLLALTLRYGICRDVCIPEQLTVQGELPVTGSSLSTVAPALSARLSHDGGVVTGRRVSPTLLCLDRLPVALRTAEVIADSGAGIDPALTPRVVGRATHLSVPATAALRTGAALLFVRGTSGVAARLDLTRATTGCTVTAK